MSVRPQTGDAEPPAKPDHLVVECGSGDAEDPAGLSRGVVQKKMDQVAIGGAQPVQEPHDISAQLVAACVASDAQRAG